MARRGAARALGAHRGLDLARRGGRAYLERRFQRRRASGVHHRPLSGDRAGFRGFLRPASHRLHLSGGDRERGGVLQVRGRQGAASERRPALHRFRRGARAQSAHRHLALPLRHVRPERRTRRSERRHQRLRQGGARCGRGNLPSYAGHGGSPAALRRMGADDARGPLRAEYIVNAAGLWAREVGRLIGGGTPRDTDGASISRHQRASRSWRRSAGRFQPPSISTAPCICARRAKGFSSAPTSRTAAIGRSMERRRISASSSCRRTSIASSPRSTR